MVESASIDKQSHERKPCGSIGELEQLEEALTAALTYAQSHPNTLILVTADHSQAAQLERLAAEGQLSAFRHEGFWLPMDTLRDKHVLDEMWKAGRAPWKLWS